MDLFVVECLLRNGALIDTQSGSLSTALHLAVRKGHLKTVEVLLRYKDQSIGLVIKKSIVNRINCYK